MITKINNGGSGISVNAGDTITVQAAGGGVTATAGAVSLDASTTVGLAVPVAAADVIINDVVTTNGSGITISAKDSITFGAGGDVTSANAGNVIVTANTDAASGGSGDLISMASGAVINAGSGTINLSTAGANGGAIALGQLTTINASNPSVTITSNTAITDNNTGTNNVTTGGRLVADAATGIGTVANQLEVIAESLRVDNTGTGEVGIINAAVTGVSIISMTTNSGAINYDQSGGQTLAITSVSTTDSDINIDNTGGIGADIEIGLITADTTDDVVTITSTGAIDDLEPEVDAILAVDITGFQIDLNAAEGIGASAPLELGSFSTMSAISMAGDINLSQMRNSPRMLGATRRSSQPRITR